MIRKFWSPDLPIALQYDDFITCRGRISDNDFKMSTFWNSEIR